MSSSVWSSIWVPCARAAARMRAAIAASGCWRAPAGPRRRRRARTRRPSDRTPRAGHPSAGAGRRRSACRSVWRCTTGPGGCRGPGSRYCARRSRRSPGGRAGPAGGPAAATVTIPVDPPRRRVHVSNMFGSIIGTRISFRSTRSEEASVGARSRMRTALLTIAVRTSDGTPWPETSATSAVQPSGVRTRSTRSPPPARRGTTGRGRRTGRLPRPPPGTSERWMRPASTISVWTLR